SGRARIIAAEHVPHVYKKNGDVLPTFLVGGTVAGLWSHDSDGDRATVRIEPFSSLDPGDRAVLTDEAERLVRYVAPDAADHQVGRASWPAATGSIHRERRAPADQQAVHDTVGQRLPRRLEDVRAHTDGLPRR